MQDRQLYAQILGITQPWQVARVDLQLDQGQVDVYLEHGDGQAWPCAKCGASMPLYDHQPERTWRHLDTCQYRTIIHAMPPRTSCPQDGVLTVRLPWAEATSRFTTLFESVAISWLKVASQAAVARNLQLSWDEVHAIMERAVRRGLARRQAEPVARLAIDETAARRGHRYLTVVSDGQRVVYVAEDRKTTSLDGFWRTLTAAQKTGIAAVSLDMWEPYIASIRAHLPDAERKMVFDKFHVAKHLGDALDQVRRGEHRQLRRQGDDRLTGTKYDWLRNPAAFSATGWREFAALRTSTLKTARAWALREAAMELFGYRYEGAARRFFNRWYYWATHSRLAPMIAVAKMLKTRLANLLTYLKHPITNAIAESLNAKIQWAKYTARGYRNTNNLITAIYFHCGGLQLNPLPT